MTMLSNYSLYFYVSTHRFVLLSTCIWKDSFGSGSMQRFTLVKLPSIDNNEGSIVNGSSVSMSHHRRLEERHERGERRTVRNRVEGRGIDKMLVSGHDGNCTQNLSGCLSAQDHPRKNSVIDRETTYNLTHDNRAICGWWLLSACHSSWGKCYW